MSKGLTLVLVTWISFNFHQIFSLTIPCHETYQAQNGHQCYPCSKGFYKISDCVANGEQARCRPCGHGKYQPSCDNSPMCDTCRPHCHPGQIKVKDCETTSDIKCECNDPGSFWLPDPWKENEGHCRQHSKCKDGEELVKEGTPYNDTVCLPCQDGVTHSNEAANGRCRACSVCNTTVIQPCNVTHDVICDRVTTEPPSSTYAPSAGLGVDGIVGIVAPVVVSIIGMVIVVTVVVYRRCRQNRSMKESSYIESNGSIGSNRNISEGYHSETSSLDVKGENDIFLNPIHNETQKNVNKNGESNTYVVNIDHNKLMAAEADIPPPKDKTMFSNASDSERISPEEQLIRSSEARKLPTDGCFGLGSDISTDAYALPPRALSSVTSSLSLRVNLPQDKSKMRGHNQRHDGDNEEVEGDTIQAKPNVEIGTGLLQETSHDGPDTRGNYVATDSTGRNDLVRRSSTNEDQVWSETTMDFVAHNLKFDDFKRFYRKLTARTNAEFYKRVDVKIENSGEEERTVNERMYQLMIRWRESTPQASLDDLLDALRMTDLCKVCEDLLKTLESNGLLDRSMGNQCLNVQDIETGREVGPRRELSNSTIETEVVVERLRNTPEISEPWMMELKSDCGDI